MARASASQLRAELAAHGPNDTQGVPSRGEARIEPYRTLQRDDRCLEFTGRVLREAKVEVRPGGVGRKRDGLTEPRKRAGGLAPRVQQQAKVRQSLEEIRLDLNRALEGGLGGVGLSERLQSPAKGVVGRRKAGPQRNGALKRVPRGGMFACRAQHDAEIAPGVGVAGFQLRGPPQRGLGFGHPAGEAQACAQVIVDHGLLRGRGGSTLKSGNRNLPVSATQRDQG